MRMRFFGTRLGRLGVVALLLTTGARCDERLPWTAVGYGDSITSEPPIHSAKWCSVLKGSGSCRRLGVSGERTVPGVARLLTDLAAGRIEEQFVVLAWGANDIAASGDKTVTILDPIESAVVELLLAGHVPVLWQVTPRWLPINELPQQPDVDLNAVIEGVNAEIEAMAQAYGVPLVRGYEVLRGHPELFKDHVHPNFYPKRGQLMLARAAEWSISIWALTQPEM